MKKQAKNTDADLEDKAADAADAAATAAKAAAEVTGEDAPRYDPDKEAAAALAADKPAKAPKGITEEAIGEKVKAGLRREQAIEVLEAQAAHDAALAATGKNKGKA